MAVINTGESPVRSVYVVIVLKDQDGNVIEANSVSIFDEDPNALLYPSERAFFQPVHQLSDPSRVFSKDVEIYYEDGTDEPHLNKALFSASTYSNPPSLLAVSTKLS